MQRGWKFYSIAMDHPIHRRMAALVRACSGSEPCGTRGIVEAMLCGREASLTRKQAYHLCERLIGSAVSHGFVRRLPVRGVSASVSRGRVVYKESLYMATDAGRFFLERHENMLRMAGSSPEERDALRRGGEARNRSRTLSRYERRMRTGVPDGL